MGSSFEAANNQPEQGAIISGKYTLGPLINNEGFSLLLASDGEEIVLQVRGLRTTRKSAYREIINIFVCVGSFDDDGDEAIVRGIAVKALRGELDDLINEQVHFSSSEVGFEVKNELIKALSQLKSPTICRTLEPVGKVDEDTPENRRILADELESNALERCRGTFVVVTKKAEKHDLEKALVWRGLSSKIELAGKYNLPPLATKPDKIGINNLPQLLETSIEKIKNWVELATSEGSTLPHVELHSSKTETPSKRPFIPETEIIHTRKPQKEDIAQDKNGDTSSSLEQHRKDQDETSSPRQFPHPQTTNDEGFEPSRGQEEHRQDNVYTPPDIPQHPEQSINRPEREMQQTPTSEVQLPHSNSSFTNQSLTLAVISLGVLAFMFIVMVIVFVITHANMNNIAGLLGIVIILCITIFAINIYFSYSRKKNNDKN